MAPSHPLKDDAVPVIVVITAHLSYIPVLNFMIKMKAAYMMDCLFIQHYKGKPHSPLPQCNTHYNI